MNVSGIRPYEGFYQYNSIKLNELRNQQIAAAQQETRAQEIDPEQAKRQEQEIAAFAAGQTFDSYDFAQQYKPDETFDLKGADSDIASLDISKAVSDLDKDQLLQQYQYFVGTDVSVSVKAKEPQDVVLRSGENFSL